MPHLLGVAAVGGGGGGRGGKQKKQKKLKKQNKKLPENEMGTGREEGVQPKLGQQRRLEGETMTGGCAQRERGRGIQEDEEDAHQSGYR